MRIISKIAAFIVVAAFTGSVAAADTVTSASKVELKSKSISTQAKINSAITPASKTNWTKIKDLFL